jgi:hypothetical protein
VYGAVVRNLGSAAVAAWEHTRPQHPHRLLSLGALVPLVLEHTAVSVSAYMTVMKRVCKGRLHVVEPNRRFASLMGTPGHASPLAWP